MGILRTDKISGLETPTAVTGSVEFDGNGDYLSFATSTDFALGTDDWTVEWFAYPTSETQYQRHFYLEGSSSSNIDGVFADSSGIAFGRTGVWAPTAVPHPLNQWNHYALVHDSTNMRLYINGVESLTSTDNFGTDSTKTLNIGYSNSTFGGYFTGNISNFRILRGTALYTSDFTVPTQELEVIGDTVLLCCNNPDSAGAEATGKTITVNGDAAASTFSPGLTRDFTSGTEFKGVTTFDTQGYFVPPSGTTEQRNSSGTRGLFAGNNPSPDGNGNTIEFITISTTGNTQDFGDRIGKGRRQIAAMSDRTRAVFAGSYSPLADTIDFVTIASTGNATDFGNCLTALTEATGISNSTRGIMAGGRTPSTDPHDVIQYITIKSLGNAVDFGNLSEVKRNCGSFQSSTRGVVAGGRTPTNLNVMEYITIATTGNVTDFGDLDTAGGQSTMGGSNSVRGIVAGGNPNTNAIEYVTIASTGNSQDFGDNTATEDGMNTMATSPTRACMYGAAAPLRDLSYVEIASTGNALDFGSFTMDPTSSYHSGCSNGHGGLS